MITACIFTCLFGVYKDQENVHADTISEEYMETIYNTENGLGSTEVTTICQTESGNIWIGTESGLYRFNGSEFVLFNLWETDKEDVYCINSLFQDSKGRLWIGTDNYGLFYIYDSEVVHFSEDYYNGVKIINDICEDSLGNVYVATAYGLYTYSGGEEVLTRNEDLVRKNIQKVTLAKETIWGIYNGNTIFSVNKEGKISEYPSDKYTEEELSTITSDKNGKVYVGTVGNDLLYFKNIKSVKILESTYDGINDILVDSKHIFVCTDSGIGYFNSEKTFTGIKDIDIKGYVSSMIIDYEGNYWFGSKRSGILYMSRSKFSYLNKKYRLSDTVTNVVLRHNGMTYIGSDDGLVIIDSDGKLVSNELTDYLQGVSVRDIKVDLKGSIWIATYRRFGLVKVTSNGKISSFNRAKGLVSNLMNSICILNNGNIAAATEDGISLLDTSGNVYKTYDYNSNIDYPNITSIYQDKDNVIYAGSDGGGLYVIKDDKIRNYTEDDGLSSNVITCLTMGENGLWIGTNNGLSFYNETFRSISNIDYSNIISDILIKNKKVYLLGSKGLIITDENELLGTAPLSERYYSAGDGLSSPVTGSSKNFISDKEILYICTGKGVLTFNVNKIPTNEATPKISVTDVNVDGKIIRFNQSGSSITIPSDSQRVEISFAVLSFSNRENIEITYQLEGFDTEPQKLNGTDSLEAVYTNLDGGKYVFRITASNGDAVGSKETLSFNIDKKLKFYEFKLFRIFVTILIILIVIAAIYLLLYLRKQFLGKNREYEDLSKVHEDAIKSSTAKTDYLANMSNEIKLPLNAIISKVNGMIKDGSVDSKTAEELRSIIDKSNDVLGKVDETILLARLESGSEDVVSEPYSITTLICDLSDNMLNKLSEQPIKFVVDLGENIPDILIGDFNKIKTVLDIILDNAIKYTKEGSITLSVDYFDSVTEKNGYSNLIFNISDTGTGISEDRLEHIFEIYYVDEIKKSVSNNGNGISLSIAHKIVELMDGYLEVESTPGAGSTFTLSLKQKKPVESETMIPMNENTIERVSREEAERMWAPDLRILLVDDVEISRNVLTDVIKSMDVKVESASSGLSAIDMVINNDYDMVFMDIAMPVMNGIDALKEIRDLSDPKYQSLPVIAMSEDVIGKNRQDIIDEGFSDIVLKPFDITVFAGIINRFADAGKIKYRTNDVTQYINDSRYSAGLKKLEDFFDVMGTLEKIGGNIDVYNRILSTFYSQNEKSIEELDFRFKNDYRGFRNRIHNIRNGCQNIGAIEASEIALRLENAVNEGDKSYVRDNLSLMFDCITVINQYIKEYLDFVKDQNSNSSKTNESLDSSENENVSENTSSNESIMIPETSETSDNYDADEDEENISSEYEENNEQNDYDDINIIDIEKLRKMRECTYLEDINSIRTLFKDICKEEYGSDDMDFLNVLGESIEKKDFVQINDLLGTYLSLKGSE